MGVRHRDHPPRASPACRQTPASLSSVPRVVRKPRRVFPLRCPTRSNRGWIAGHRRVRRV